MTNCRFRRLYKTLREHAATPFKVHIVSIKHSGWRAWSTIYNNNNPLRRRSNCPGLSSSINPTDEDVNFRTNLVSGQSQALDFGPVQAPTQNRTKRKRVKDSQIENSKMQNNHHDSVQFLVHTVVLVGHHGVTRQRVNKWPVWRWVLEHVQFLKRIWWGRTYSKDMFIVQNKLQK